MRSEILNILESLEQFRVKVENKEVNASNIDWTIRMCQAKVAHGHFESRMEWAEILRRRNKAN